MSVNGARGETTIQADGREIRLLYTNRALAEAEKQVGRSVIGIAQGFADGTSGITEVAHLLRAGMEAARRDGGGGGRVVSLNDAYQVLDELGFSAVTVAVMEGVAAVLSYGAESEDDESPNG